MDHNDCIDCQWFYIGDYILNKLYDLGVRNIFGIPGDYVLDFVELIEKFEGIKFINTCDENGAAIAADTYARLNNVGCLCITYGVGGLKTLNALANAYVEKSPVILISGSPPIYEKSKFNDAHMLHHEVAKNNTQLIMMKEVTCYQAVLSDPFTAITELENAFTSLRKNSQPIYIELPKDFTFEKGYFIKTPIQKSVDPNFTSSLWEAASEMMHMIKNSKHAIIMVGLEVGRYRLKGKVNEFIERTQIPFCTTVMGKSFFGENNLLFAGCYVGKMSNKEVYNYVESRDCCIMMGVQVTDTVSGIFSSKRFLKNDDNIKLNMNGIQINNHFYNNITMEQVLNLILNSEEFQEDINDIYYTRHAYRHSTQNPTSLSLNENHSSDNNSDSDQEEEKSKRINNINENNNLKNSGTKKEIQFRSSNSKLVKTNLPSSFLKKIIHFEPSNKPLKNDIIYRIINRWINSNTTVICDVGDPSFGTYDLFIPNGAAYINPAIYLSLGYGVPATLGACAAEPTRRIITICGDGGFQMTCQEISALARYHYHPVIIVLNNNGYTTERGLDKDIEKANDIHSWNYEKLIELIGSGRYIGNIKTEKDLDLALCHCFDMDSSLASYKAIENANMAQMNKFGNRTYIKNEYKEENENENENKQGNEDEDENENEKKPKKGEIPFTYIHNYNTAHDDYDDYGTQETNWNDKFNKAIGPSPIREDDAIKDMIYSKEWKKLIPFSEYVEAYTSSKEKIGKTSYDISSSSSDHIYDNDINNNSNNNNINQGQNNYGLKLKSNYLTLIEIQLDELDMSYGTQRFITLSQKKK